MKMKRTLAVLFGVMMLICCLSVTAHAASGASISVVADKTQATANDTVTYTVYLCDSDKVDGGVWNYEFQLSIPDGLTFVAGSGKIDSGFEAATGFANANFSESSMMSLAFGAIGKGYTGGDVAIMSFQCTVDADAQGDLTVSAANVGLTNKDGKSMYPGDAGATVKVIVPHVCAPVDVPAQAPTCTEDGVKAHKACSCGKLYDANGKEITAADVKDPAIGHKWGDWTKVDDDNHKQTCSNSGCGESEIVAHTWDAGKVTKPATCTEKGETTYTCTACKHTKVEKDVDMIAHTFGSTYESDEKTHWHVCTVCKTEKSEAVAHNYDQAVVLEKPTATTDGKAQMTCVCGAKGEIRAIPATGEELDNVPKTGDITPQITTAVLLLLALCAVTGTYMFKRREVK